MLPRLLFTISGCLFSAMLSRAQVGINTTTPSAQLEIKSSNQATPSNTDGILIPKVDTFPATNPTASQQAMMVYLTTASGSNLPGFYYWDNTTTTWIAMASVKGWNLTGNSGTAPVTNFFGTTDNQPLAMRTNNTERLRIDTSGNIGMGTTTPQSKLHLFTGASGLTPNVFSPAVIEGNGLTYLNILSTLETGVVFGSGGSGTNGGIVYNSGIFTNGMNFRTGGNQNRMNISSTGQVSIGNALANARLQAFSSNQAAPANTDGIIIPKIDAFPATVPNAAQQSMLVYLTTAVGANLPGFYYWDNTTTSWIGIASSSNHVDWYEEATTKAPNAITDDMYHLGNIAIGKTTASYPLEVDNSTFDRALSINVNYAGASSATAITNTMTGSNSVQQIALKNSLNNSGASDHTGVYNSLSGSGSGSHYGLFNDFSGAGDGIQTGVSNTNFNSGNANHYGMSNLLGGSGTGKHYGVRNDLTGTGNGDQYGMMTAIDNTGIGSHYGIYNTMVGAGNGFWGGAVNFFNLSGSGDNTGVSNDMTKTGNGNVRGFKSLVNGTGNGIYYGLDASINNNGTGNSFGCLVQNFGSSPGIKYGLYSYIDATAGGTQIGIYSEATKPGSNNFAAYFVGNVGIRDASGNHYILPQSRGTNDQIMQTDGVGNVTWKNPNTALNSYAWGTTGNSGTNAGTNFIGTTDNADLSLRTNGTEVVHLATSGNVGINTATPTADLEVNGFTKLGSASPAIKTLKLTGTTALSQGGSTLIPHGLTSTKILGVTILVEYAPGAFVPNSYNFTTGFEYDFYLTTTSIGVVLKAANSANILSKPFKVLLTYEQ